MVSVCTALACGLTACSPILAAPLPVSKTEQARYARDFTAIQRQTRTFHADLRQVLRLQGVIKPIVSLGTLDYQAPRKMLLRFSQPAGEWMLIDETHLAVKKQGQPLQLRDLADGRMPSHAASLLDFFHSDASHWSQDFQVTVIHDGNLLEVHLKPYLTPTAPSQGIDEITTTLQLPGYLISGIDLQINPANRIIYEFIHAQRNIPINPTLFELPVHP